MKKTYQSPEMNVVNVTATQHLLAGSGGVTDGSKVGNSFNSNDVTFSRGDSWDDED